MRRHFALAVAAIVLAIVLATAGASTGAQAQWFPWRFPCDAFSKNPDGSWTAMRDVSVPGGSRIFDIGAGSVLRPGEMVSGVDLVGVLAEKCPRVAVVAPPPPVSVTASPAALSKLTDANGLIDVQKLTCAQLAETSEVDADVLLLWHSGWYNAMAKKRLIDLPRVKEGIRNVLLYCKANMDKRVVHAMDLYLKDRR